METFKIISVILALLSVIWSILILRGINAGIKRLEKLKEDRKKDREKEALMEKELYERFLESINHGEDKAYEAPSGGGMSDETFDKLGRVMGVDTKALRRGYKNTTD